MAHLKEHFYFALAVFLIVAGESLTDYLANLIF